MGRHSLTDEEGEVRELTAEDLASFRPMAEVDPGALVLSRAGTSIALNLPADVVATLLALGADTDRRVEKALRAAIEAGTL